MLKLYARKGAGSDAVEALLAVCDQPCDIEYLTRATDGYDPPTFRQINPKGEVPTLVLADGSVMTESAAIMIYLADAFPTANMAPALSSPLRPAYLRWMLFLATAPYVDALLGSYPQRYTTVPGEAAGIKAQALLAADRDYSILSNALADGPFLLGQTMSAVDIYAAMLVSWADDVPGLRHRHQNLATLFDRVIAHRKIAPVWSHLVP